MEYYSAIKKWNNAIYSNMDGLRNCHTKWSESDRERQISYDIAYIWNLKKNGTNEPIYKTEIVTDVENKQLPRRKGGEGGINWEIGIDIHTHYYIQNR